MILFQKMGKITLVIIFVCILIVSPRASSRSLDRYSEGIVIYIYIYIYNINWCQYLFFLTFLYRKKNNINTLKRKKSREEKILLKILQQGAKKK